MNLAEAEQWYSNFADQLDDDHPFVALMANYHRRGQELARLARLVDATLGITQNLDHATHEMGASLNRLTAALQPEVNR